MLIIAFPEFLQMTGCDRKYPELLFVSCTDLRQLQGKTDNAEKKDQENLADI